MDSRTGSLKSVSQYIELLKGDAKICDLSCIVFLRIMMHIFMLMKMLQCVSVLV